MYESRKEQAVLETAKVRKPVRKRQSESFKVNEGLSWCGVGWAGWKAAMTKIMLNQNSMC